MRKSSSSPRPISPRIRGLSFGIVVGSRTAEGRATWQRYWSNSVDVPSAATEQLGRAAQAAGAYVVIGVIERETTGTRGTLYCTLLYFGPDGRLLGKHRKLKPTAGERLIWGEGDGSTLTVVDTPYGRLGGLICWENYMPLARTAMYEQGRGPLRGAHRGQPRHLAGHAAAHRAAKAAASSSAATSSSPSPCILRTFRAIEDLDRQPEMMCRGGSAIVSPLGEVVAGPLWDEEGMLYADLDMGEVTRGRFDFDVTGHYARPDVFQLVVR